MFSNQNPKHGCWHCQAEFDNKAQRDHHQNNTCIKRPGATQYQSKTLADPHKPYPQKPDPYSSHHTPANTGLPGHSLLAARENQQPQVRRSQRNKLPPAHNLGGYKSSLPDPGLPYPGTAPNTNPPMGGLAPRQSSLMPPPPKPFGPQRPNQGNGEGSSNPSGSRFKPYAKDRTSKR